MTRRRGGRPGPVVYDTVALSARDNALGCVLIGGMRLCAMERDVEGRGSFPACENGGGGRGLRD